MSASIPETMKAVVIENGKAVVKQDIPIPELEEGFVLIKTVAVAGNPTDWKHIDFKIGPQGALLGCDAASQIVSWAQMLMLHALPLVITFMGLFTVLQ